MPDYEESRSQEKLVIAAVAAIGLVTVVFGFMSLRRSIVAPFAGQGAGDYKTPSQLQAEALEALKTVDTDSDQLSDYDELYIFRTNPYLDDTDSDGIIDSTEIAASSDPNCPQGQTCRVASLEPGTGGAVGGGSASEDVSVEDLTPEQQATLAFIELFGDPTQLTREQAESTVRELPEQKLRDFFIAMGVPAETVDDADEETLRDLTIEALSEITFGQEIIEGAGALNP
jgi:hypothetical protein